MIDLIESQTIEFKQIWKDEYLKTVCALANTDGGEFYIGICDNKKIIGLDNIESLLEVLPNKINNRLGLMVDVSVQQVENKNIIKITIEKTYAPVSFNGKFYKRSGSNTISIIMNSQCLILNEKIA